MFRILFGLVLLSDLARRWAELGFWYANSGLLPNHTLLWRPPARYMFSLFFGASSVREAQLGFVLCGLVYLAFIAGYRTGWVQLLTLLARVSLNTRLAVLENGGDMVMDLLCLLTLPLPLGARFSLDSVATSLRDDPASVEAARQWRKPVYSVAVLGLILQFATIYFFNAASKSGHAWRDGSAVHFALHQDKLVTWLGVWMRDHLPVDVLRGLTWATLATEWLGFWLIISPFYTRQLRLVAVCIMPCLHLGFALGLNLGGFSPAMMSFYPLLLTAEHWDAFERRFGARLRPWSTQLSQRAAELLRYLPLPHPRPPSTAWRALGNAAVALLLVAIASEVLNDNVPVPRALRVTQPEWARAVIDYPRILQGWRMFAAEPSRMDSMIYVDAVTASGVHVDPYNEVASDQHYPAGDVVPTHMGQSQFFVMYSDRIANGNYASYRQAFSEWLLAYPERTGNPRDCLLSYEVFYVSDHSPPVGRSVSPKPVDRQRFMSYSAPWESDCRKLQANGAGPATSQLLRR